MDVKQSKMFQISDRSPQDTKCCIPGISQDIHGGIDQLSSSGILRRHSPAGVSLEKGHRNDQRNEIFLRYRKAEELGLFYMEKAPGRPY